MASGKNLGLLMDMGITMVLPAIFIRVITFKKVNRVMIDKSIGVLKYKLLKNFLVLGALVSVTL